MNPAPGWTGARGWERGELPLYGSLGFELRMFRLCGLVSFAIKGAVTVDERLRDWDERVAVRVPYI